MRETGPPQAQEVVVLADHLVARSGEVQREGGHVATEIVDPEDEFLGKVIGVAPHHKTDAGVGKAILVAADVDRHHPRQPEVPLQVGLEERNDESPAGGVDVDRNVEALLLLQLVQGRADRGDRFQFAGVGGADDADHADGVLVDGLDHLFRGDDVAVLGHRQVAGFDLEVAAEFLPHHLHVGAHHQIRGAGFPAVAVFAAHPLLPPPLQRQTAQHHRLGGPDRGGADCAGGVVVAQILGMEKVGNHCHTARFDCGGGRVLVLVDHVLVERLGHQPLSFRVHPGGDEGRQIQPGTPVEHQFVVDEPVRRRGLHGLVGQAQRRDGVGGQPAGVGRGDRRGPIFDVRHALVSLLSGLQRCEGIADVGQDS